MVTHLTRKKDIRPLGYRSFHQEIAGTSTQSHFSNLTRRAFIVHQTFYSENISHTFKKCHRFLGGRKIAHYATTAFHTGTLSLQHKKLYPF